MSTIPIVLAVHDSKVEHLVRSVADDLPCVIQSDEGIDAARSLLANDEPTLIICNPSSFDALRVEYANVAALLIANRGESQQTIDAMKHGALDCLFSPVDRDQLAQRMREAIDIISQPRLQRSARRGMVEGAGPIIGQSPAMQEVYKFIGLVAPRDVNVLITGESGTGKEMVARAIHDNSRRSHRPFIPVHCAAIPETLLETELFGHEKGAFTGADARRKGKFEQAHGGTLFLDEVGDIPAAIQAKLLRVLQDQIFTRLGGNEAISADIRILAATHRPLEKLMRDGEFREDLFYRLKVATIHLPPLREREVDAVLLAHFFAERHNASLGANIQHFSPQAVATLLSYSWPGNVRELENVIKSSLVVARGSVMRADFLPHAINAGRSESDQTALGKFNESNLVDQSPDGLHEWLTALLDDASRKGNVLAHATNQLHRALLLRVLDRQNGQLSQTAEFLGVSRTTLRKKMRDLGVSVRRKPQSRETKEQ